MSNGLSSFEQEMILANNFLEDTFPDSVIQPVNPFDPSVDPDQIARLHAAGLGLAEVEDAGETLMVTYVREPEHVVVKALTMLFEAGDDDRVYNEAIDSIRDGTLFSPLDQLVILLDQ